MSDAFGSVRVHRRDNARFGGGSQPSAGIERCFG